MTKREINKVIKAAGKLDWNTTYYGGEFEFSKYSPAGQDFNISVSAGTTDELQREIRERHNNFDCSAEAYLWLDNTGHGTNGAPYDMKDVYEDMGECEKMLGELADEIMSMAA